MKAITIWQPWASLIYTGAKKIETRNWATKYRGPLAIHAAKRWDTELQSHLFTRQMYGGLAPLVGKPLDFTFNTYIDVTKIKNLYKGAIIATCNLIDCVPVENLTLKDIEIEQYYGDFSPGRVAWILDNVKPLKEPIKAKGKQRIWNWEVESE